MEIVQQVVHYFLHFVFPGLIAFFFFRKTWKRTYLVFLLTMLVDLDHLLATPVFSPCRCSIGFHILHDWIAISAYVLMLFHPKLRVIAIGLLMHMGTDSIDCLFSNFNCR